MEIILTILNKDIVTLRQLLDKDCFDVDVADVNGDTALLFSSRNGDYDIVKELLKFGASPTKCNLVFFRRCYSITCCK